MDQNLRVRVSLGVPFDLRLHLGIDIGDDRVISFFIFDDSQFITLLGRFGNRLLQSIPEGVP